MRTKHERLLKFQINSDEWKFRVLTKEQMEKRHGDDIHGLTQIDRHIVDLRQDHLSLPLIRHELFHVHLSYTFTGSAELSQDSMEEICADLFAERGDLMQAQAREIFNELRR